MAKIGRNEPCPCGSGKKYKACCLQKDQDAELQAQKAQNAAQKARAARVSAMTEEEYAYEVELAETSNAVVDMVHAGRLDEAEAAARELLERFPDVHDGYDRLGMVFEARGDRAQAIVAYQAALDFVRAHPDDYDDAEFENLYVRLIERLQKPPASD